MNALKKLLSVFLVACMALSVCAVYFAEGTEALPRVMAMKGPTAMGLSKLMTDEAASYDFSIASAIDEITPKLVKGEIDLPAALDARTSLMDWGTVSVESAEPDLGGLRVRGKVMVETLISSGVTGRPAALVKYPMEFDRLIELLPDLLEKGEAYFAEKKAAKEAEKAKEA